MTRTETLTIEGMTCEHCVRAVREALEGVDGVEVESVRVGEARVRLDDARADRAGLAAALDEEGYTLVG
ncbi:MAG TPA: heavy-metal-associated domain-containing protein [Rubricoccaceae bacterium]|jgi:copper chaperone CopZ